MAGSRVVTRYIRSLLGLASEMGVLEKVHADMQLISATCNNSREFVLMLKSPIIKHDQKRSILEIIFKRKVNALTLSIFDIITRKNREPLLPSIAGQFHQAYNEHKGIGQASVTTTIALDAKTRKEIEDIAKKLSERTKIELEEKVNEDLIGGFVLNVGDKQVDASIRSKINLLKVKFSENPYIKEF